MMSVNIFSIKKMLHRRIWSMMLCALFFFCYYVLGTFLIVMNTTSYSHTYGYTSESIREQMMTSISMSIGVRMQYGWIFVILLAIVLGIQGFSYMDSRQEMDFYESQPEKRSARFVRIYLGGILIYAVMSLSGLLFALLIAKGAGALTAVMIADAVYESARLLILFLGVYAVSVLAVMLTGNIMTAILADFVLLFYEMAASGVIYSLEDTFFATFAPGKTTATAFLSPVYIYSLLSGDNYVYYSVLTGPGENYGLMTAAYLKQCFAYVCKYDLLSLLLFAAVTGLAYLAYQKRKSEYAGISVVYGWVRIAAKLAVAVLCSLEAGLLACNSGASGSHAEIVTTVTVMLLTAIIVCAVMQVIYELDFAAILHGAWAMAAAGAAAIIIFTSFRNDVFGYDRFLPQEEEVESAALLTPDGEGNCYLADGTVLYDTDRYRAACMKLTDVGDVLRLAEYGMNYTEEGKKRGKDAGMTEENTYSMTILYRMKNGREVYRMITVPESVDSSLLNPIMESDEYKSAALSCFINADFALAAQDNGEICYDTGWTSRSEGASGIRELLTALREDADANYNFTMLRDMQPLGEITVRNTYLSESAGSSDAEAIFRVYPCCEKTIAWLTEQGIYSETLPDPADVSLVDVVNSHIAYERESPEAADSDLDRTVRAEYTDKDKIRSILGSCRNSQFVTSWQPMDDEYLNYSVEIRLNSGVTVYGYFKSGEVPQFVADDTAVD